MKIIAIAIGGSIGAVLRYASGQLVYRFLQPVFPWGTLAVNLFGSFLIGVIVAIAGQTIIPPLYRDGILIGFIGSYTTFSTLMFESVQLIQDKEYGLVMLNIGVSVATGLLAVFLGLFVGGLIKEHLL